MSLLDDQRRVAAAGSVRVRPMRRNPVRTIVGLANSNCSWCLNVMADRLAGRPLVHEVHLDVTAGCLVVDHDDDDPAVLVAEIHRNLRGWEMADNGEAVMVDVGVHEVSACRRAATAPTTARGGGDSGWSPRDGRP